MKKQLLAILLVMCLLLSTLQVFVSAARGNSVINGDETLAQYSGFGSGFAVYGYTDTAAETYKNDNDFEFVSMALGGDAQDSIVARYKEILKNHPAVTTHSYVINGEVKTYSVDTQYTLYDIDKNGVSELFVKEDNSFNKLFIYTIVNGQTCPVEMKNADIRDSHARWGLYEYDGNGIIGHGGGEGNYRAEYLTLFSLEDNFLSLESYDDNKIYYHPEASELYDKLKLLTPIKFYPVTDDSHLASMITSITEKTNYNGHTYQILYSSHGWDEMQAYMETTGGYLACITSAEENQWIYNFAAQNGITNAWFGYSDAEEEGNWKWVSSETSNYTNWAPGEPNNEGGREHYAGYYFGDGTWNDGTYPSNCYYLCEWPRIITPVDPAPTITPIPTASPNPTTKPTAAPTVNPSSAPTEDERYRKVRSLAYDWVSEYNNYLSSLKNGLTKIASNNIKKHDLDSAAKSLEKQYGTLITATANLTEQQRHYIYKAVLELLAKTANDRLDLSSL